MPLLARCFAGISPRGFGFPNLGFGGGHHRPQTPGPPTMST
ncbi:hypothetical protein GGE06_004814 [Streptomyces sp. SFB5A]|uniref:Uncharacterized protein n=1 Tax=Streptomyces nymphaeiformis TaxID=2663842 RepID=A0A7W7XE52_9ACTN|nr:hypothetical protein [Streptomyces nymphaeiformis]